ncbi:sensor histidine kinase [Mucilaginibacter kameinonensis]|uniref:sensor histidine kinase n=1 Tax=Mucilaginibacter kameinonensis TaxID=452286 RepID=UPI000EF7F75F|nr:ATP-binding protein [Mucilaginibacter kameinonensis]
MFKEHQEVLITVVVGVLLILFLVAVFIFSIVKYKRKVTEDIKERLAMRKNFENILFQAQIEVQESTLSTLSREIHDNIGQLLSTAKMLLNITVRDSIEPAETLLVASETLTTAINELRALSKSLNKDWLVQFDLIKNLEAEAERINSGKSLLVVLKHTGNLMISSDHQIILFRIIQEALQNTIKHSNSNIVHIESLATNELIEIKIEDNGNGFDIRQMSDGIGISNMKQRTNLLGGTIEWTSMNNNCSVFIKIPVTQC